MKRRFLILGCGFLLAIGPLASVWAVWEGNAGIAAASEFPGSGLYARSDMFPKNTIVEIVNLEAEITVRAVITGASGVPGLVAVLAPDTAAALNIRAGSVSRVRISIPSVAERPAAGTEVDSSRITALDPDVNPSAATAGAVVATVPPSTVPPELPLEPTASVDVAQLESISPEAVEAPVVSPSEETESETITPDESPVIEAPVTSESPQPDASPALGITEAAPVPIPLPIETPTEVVPEAATVPEVSAPETPAVAESPIPETKESETAATFYDEPSVSTPNVDVSLIPAEPLPPPEPVASPPLAESVPLSEPIEKPIAPVEIAPPPAESTTVPIVDATAVVPVETVPILTIQSSTESGRPPVETTTAMTATFPESVPTPTEKKDVAKEPVEKKILPQETIPVVPAPVSESFPFIASLTKGSYYIQIASFSDSANVREIIDSYGKKYPIAVEKATGKNGAIMKVYIGPVRKDEYGAVLERFKGLGFKDAFVRKGQ